MRLVIVTTSARMLMRLVGYGLLGGFIVAAVIYIRFLESRPDLSVWHHADLDAEYTEDSDVGSFDQYLELEDRLFAQLDELVYAEVPQGPKNVINRFSRGSISDPGRWPKNWNRSFTLENDDPVAGVLLLHGLSDSPYSLRALGERLHDEGAWVLGLRIPGHGTAPTGLVEVRWQDMAAAVRLAARHVSAAKRTASHSISLDIPTVARWQLNTRFPLSMTVRCLGPVASCCSRRRLELAASRL